MFPRILVPVDLTDKNRAALDLCAELAVREGSEVTLLHVIETIEDVPFGDLEEFYQRLERRASERLDEWVESFRARGLVARREVVFGRRVDEVVRHAAEHGTSLIVLSSHRIDEAQAVRAVGTLSHRVAVFAGCPVLLVR